MQILRYSITAAAFIAILWPILVSAGELPFHTTSAVYQTMHREQLFDGVVEAVKQTTISAQTTGRIMEVLYDVDDFVKKNEVVVKLRDNDQRAQVDRAQANLTEAKAHFQEAESEYKRISKLLDKKLVSTSQFDKAKSETEASQARLEAAKAALALANEQLGHTLVRAPYSGIVTQRHVEVGEIAQVGQRVMSGLSLESLRVKVPVPQSLINTVRLIGRARVYVKDAQGEAIQAKRLTFFPYADVQTNTFQVRVELPQGVQGLFPGMFVKVGFITGEKRRLVVPTEALVYRSEVTGVYTVDATGKVALRHVRPGRLAKNGMIEILAGLSEGESVALEPIKAGAFLKEQQPTGSTDE
jgi:RND family efflux transporter MFP subunit